MPVLEYEGTQVWVSDEELAVLDVLFVKWRKAGQPCGLDYANEYERRIFDAVNARFRRVGWDGRPPDAVVVGRTSQPAVSGPAQGSKYIACGEALTLRSARALRRAMKAGTLRPAKVRDVFGRKAVGLWFLRSAVDRVGLRRRKKRKQDDVDLKLLKAVGLA
jgi:hypothetical protein